MLILLKGKVVIISPILLLKLLKLQITFYTIFCYENTIIIYRLVNVLEDASTVTMGARGIAYSCLIDVLTQQKQYIAGIEALKKGLTTGIQLEDVNRTALKRLKQGLDETTKEPFPFEIPKKDAKIENSTSSKYEKEDTYESETSVAILN